MYKDAMHRLKNVKREECDLKLENPPYPRVRRALHGVALRGECIGVRPPPAGPFLRPPLHGRRVVTAITEQ